MDIVKSAISKYKVYIGLFAFLVLMIVAAYDPSEEAIKVFVDAQPIGIVKAQDGIQESVENYTAEVSENGTYDVELLSSLSFEPVVVKSAQIQEKEAVTSAVLSHLYYNIVGYTVSIDDVPFYSFKSEEEANTFLENVKTQYVDPERDAVEVVFNEKVDVTAQTMSKDDISTYDEAWQTVKEGKVKKQTYTVASGDTTWDIAIRFGMSIEEIAQANIDQDLTRLQIGQEIYLNRPESWLNVQITYMDKEEQEIVGPTVYENSDDMYVGERQVKVQGEPGKKVAEIKSTYVNGLLTEEQVISEDIIQEATETVVLKGTKWREVASTGNFNNPANGVLTSRFGTRWGRMHNGIDIGAPVGTPIKASDAGVVSSARYISGYGNTVILDHGNGVQTLYGHASSLAVEVGQAVKQGDVIAYVGRTGNTTGACLHFEVRLNGKAVDPLPYVNY